MDTPLSNGSARVTVAEPTSEGEQARPAGALVGLVDTLRYAAIAENTRIAYDKGWRCFTNHCEERGVNPDTAEAKHVAEFFTALAYRANSLGKGPLSIRTLRLYRSALNRRYAEVGRDSPAAATVVGDVLRGLARTRNNPPRRVRALREYHIVAMLRVSPASVFGMRDAAMLALGFAAALRRSELCALRVRDIEFTRNDRMVVRIQRSKTDQSGEGQSVPVLEGKAIRPVTRLRAWLEATGIREGYLFQSMLRGGIPSGRALSHSEVPRLVKRYVAKIGLDPKMYSGHSLRAGFVTSAAAHHARLDKIMEITRHKNPTTVLQYVRDAHVFEDHAGTEFL